jgi:hypothetical protein
LLQLQWLGIRTLLPAGNSNSVRPGGLILAAITSPVHDADCEGSDFARPYNSDAQPKSARSPSSQLMACSSNASRAPSTRCKRDAGLGATRRRGRHWLARRWGPWGRRWNFCKDRLVGGLYFGDLAHYLVLTGGELLDGYSHFTNLSLDNLLQRGDTHIYLL